MWSDNIHLEVIFIWSGNAHLKNVSINPSRPNPGRREKIKSNFYFHTSLWYLKRFYKGLKGSLEEPQRSVKRKI